MSTDPAALPGAGLLLADRYRIESRIAGGGMGEVWRASDEILGRRVAIKFLRAELADDDHFRERLRREARAAGRISHPGVVPIYDYGELVRPGTSDLAYLVMEYVDGPSLSAELREHGSLGVERTLLILEQTAVALQAAHNAGVIHRDVKPANILVTPSGDVKIADFGIARSADATALTKTGTLTGTAHYLSPEQASGETATASSDIYSLGIVAYACLSGDVPFSEGNELTVALAHLQKEPAPLAEEIPHDVRRLVMGMLAKKPENRPRSAGVVASTVRHLLPAATQPSAPLHDLTRGAAASTSFMAGIQAMPRNTHVAGAPGVTPARSRRKLPIAAVAAVLLVLLIVAVSALSGPDSTSVPDAVGKQQTAATALMRQAGLKTTIKKSDVRGQEAGAVVTQSAKAATRIDEGSTVTLTVATGRVRVPIDDLQGASLADAQTILADLGLRANLLDQDSSNPPGTVLAVSPDDVARIGSVVDLTIAYDASALADQKGEERDSRGKEKGKKQKNADGKGKD